MSDCRCQICKGRGKITIEHECSRSGEIRTSPVLNCFYCKAVYKCNDPEHTGENNCHFEQSFPIKVKPYPDGEWCSLGTPRKLELMMLIGYSDVRPRR